MNVSKTEVRPLPAEPVSSSDKQTFSQPLSGVKQACTYSKYASRSRGKNQVLPFLTRDQLEALAESIKQAGQVYVPVIKDEAGLIIDGDARWFLSGELGIANVPVEVRPGLTEDEKIELALTVNAQRRHLDNKAKHEIIRQQLKRKPTYSSAYLSGLLGCSDKTVEAVRCEMEARSEIPTVDRVEGKDNKTYPRNRRKSIIHTDREKKDLFKDLRLLNPDDLPNRPLTPRKIHQIAAKQERMVKPGQQAPGEYHLHNVDMRDLLPKGLVKPGSVNLVMTDPLYQKDSVEGWSWLGEFAKVALAEDGVLVAYSGLITLEEAFDRLRRTGLYFRWLGVNTFTWKNHVRHVNVLSGFRPVLIFSRDDRPIPFAFCDTCNLSPKEKDQSNHPYEQALGGVKFWVAQLSRSGNLVCDPFAGSFTTGVACQQLAREGKGERHFIGSEIDPKWFAEGQIRMGYGASDPVLQDPVVRIERIVKPPKALAQSA